MLATPDLQRRELRPCDRGSRVGDIPFPQSNGRLRAGNCRRSSGSTTDANGPFWPASDRSPAVRLSHFSLLSHFEGIVNFDAQVSNSAFKFGVTQEQLYGA